MSSLVVPGFLEGDPTVGIFGPYLDVLFLFVIDCFVTMVTSLLAR